MDLLFAKLEKEQPDHFAVKQYRKFKMAAGKTLKSILISCGARISPFDIQERNQCGLPNGSLMNAAIIASHKDPKRTHLHQQINAAVDC